MGNLPILPKNGGADKWCRQYMRNRELPDFYMGDFSVMGLLVDRVDKAAESLRGGGIEVREDHGLAFADVVELIDLKQILKVLDAGGVEYQFSDIAGQIYQG